MEKNTDLYFCYRNKDGQYKPFFQLSGTFFSRNEERGGGEFFDNLLSHCRLDKMTQQQEQTTNNIYLKNENNKTDHTNLENEVEQKTSSLSLEESTDVKMENRDLNKNTEGENGGAKNIYSNLSSSESLDQAYKKKKTNKKKSSRKTMNSVAIGNDFLEYVQNIQN